MGSKRLNLYNPLTDYIKGLKMVINLGHVAVCFKRSLKLISYHEKSDIWIKESNQGKLN